MQEQQIIILDNLNSNSINSIVELNNVKQLIHNVNSNLQTT